MDKSSLTLGWLVGRQIAGQRRAVEKQPVAYLYNGVKLPALPKVEGYPYAIIRSFPHYQYAYLSIAPEYVFTTDWLGISAVVRFPKGLISYLVRWDGDDGLPSEWSEEAVISNSSDTNLEAISWSNFDIYTPSGDLYLAASDPIPVYE